MSDDLRQRLTFPQEIPDDEREPDSGLTWQALYYRRTEAHLRDLERLWDVLDELAELKRDKALHDLDRRQP